MFDDWEREKIQTARIFVMLCLLLCLYIEVRLQTRNLSMIKFYTVFCWEFDFQYWWLFPILSEKWFQCPDSCSYKNRPGKSKKAVSIVASHISETFINVQKCISCNIRQTLVIQVWVKLAMSRDQLEGTSILWCPKDKEIIKCIWIF